MSGQTRAATEAANAAKASAESLKNTERAYMVITYRQKGDDDWPEDYNFHPCRISKAPDGLTCYRLHIRVVNTGKTPATVLGGRVQTVIDLDDIGFRPSEAPNVRGQTRRELARTVPLS